MPVNVEIKALLSDVATAEAIAMRLSGRSPEIIHQTDVFFRTGPARLKLRVTGPGSGELIRYERPDIARARASRYQVARTGDPEVLLQILSETLGAVGTVKKTRRLFLVGQTRVHIDRVEGLGDFLELEVVLKPEQTEADGSRIAHDRLSEFRIDPAQLMSEAYIDLLQHRRDTIN